jgi:hypothetical protein
LEDLEGKRLPAFVYSNKVILSIKDWKKRETQEINRIKNLEKNRYWCTNNRLINVLYINDTIDKIKNVGKLTATKLNAASIIIVQDLLDLTVDKVIIISSFSKITVERINKIIDYTKETVIMTVAPLEVDYRLSPDPYLAKFGEEGRMREIRKSVFLSGNVCITDMIEHIYKESELVFKGTIHQNDWWFWHDALSLMTAKDTIAWMKEKGYFSRWLLPELDLYRDFPEVKKRYNDRPIGDTPESMPLDNNLNQDLHTDVNRQIAATMMLEEDDIRKFSTSTPNRLTDAYLRVWESVGPTSKRIIEDVLKVGPSWEEIRQNKGSYVDNVHRSGKRQQMKAVASASSKTQKGGARKRTLPTSEYGNSRLHPDAQNALDERLSDLKYKSESRALSKDHEMTQN